MNQEAKDLREIAQQLKTAGMLCNCDLDRWQPDRSTGHSHVCRIHKTAVEMKLPTSAMRKTGQL